MERSAEQSRYTFALAELLYDLFRAPNEVKDRRKGKGKGKRNGASRDWARRPDGPGHGRFHRQCACMRSLRSGRSSSGSCIAWGITTARETEGAG